MSVHFEKQEGKNVNTIKKISKYHIWGVSITRSFRIIILSVNRHVSARKVLPEFRFHLQGYSEIVYILCIIYSHNNIMVVRIT